MLTRACPEEFETATGHFDPAGYDPEDCAGCGAPLSEHAPPRTDKMSTTKYWWAICNDCDWSGPDQATPVKALRDALEHALATEHDSNVAHDESEHLRFG